MKLRKCYSCQKNKPLEEFYRKNKDSDQRQYQCITCGKERKKQYYENNRDKYIKEATKRAKQARKDNKKKLWKILRSSSCIDCEENDPRVLQFDHVRGKKKDNISRMVSTSQSWGLIEKEMEKCEIRCANCHTKITWDRSNWKTDW